MSQSHSLDLSDDLHAEIVETTFSFLNFWTVPWRFRVPGNEIKKFLFVSYHCQRVLLSKAAFYFLISDNNKKQLPTATLTYNEYCMYLTMRAYINQFELNPRNVEACLSSLEQLSQRTLKFIAKCNSRLLTGQKWVLRKDTILGVILVLKLLYMSGLNMMAPILNNEQ